ncbi:major facilitator superfamily domain-containing protein [Aspergillus cavernicola]|uniref:Major facilitator superfamily domain-containing protein n=1 Tax=Aspergillus cavernicola TaxID=176166 RepID=A0ABR4IE03_9EURO
MSVSGWMQNESVQSPRPTTLKPIHENARETKICADEIQRLTSPESKKTRVFSILMMAILNSCLGSSLPSNATLFIADEFAIESQAEKALPMSCYLIGHRIAGPLLWAPLSEQRGRRSITIGTFSLFGIFTMACAVAPTWPAFLVFRTLTGIFASGPIAVVTGILADKYQGHRTRGQAVAVYMVVTAFGPLLGPIISGFVSPSLGWRWPFWIALIIIAATFVPLLTLPETHAAVLRSQDRPPHKTPHPGLNPQQEEPNRKEFITTVLFRPLHMLIFEPIVTATSTYLALCYSIFYMSFQAYPLIFTDIYSLSPGLCGLTYRPIGLGCIITLPIFWAYDEFFAHQEPNRIRTCCLLKDNNNNNREEYIRLPIACLGGPLFAISLFWLGWSARQYLPFVVSMLAGVPFGLGFICIFIALLNYLTDAYEIYAASANAASSCSRSLLAIVLPLATGPMFDRLGVAGACSLLGGLSGVMCVIPLVFLWKGHRMRASSTFCARIAEGKKKRRKSRVVIEYLPLVKSLDIID